MRRKMIPDPLNVYLLPGSRIFSDDPALTGMMGCAERYFVG